MLLQKCLEEHETRLDPDDPRIAYDLDLLSRLNEKMGRYSTAVSLHNQALEIYQGADNEYTLENDALWSVEEEDDVACDDVVSRASDRICRSRVNYQFLIACQYEALSNAYHKMGKFVLSIDFSNNTVLYKFDRKLHTDINFLFLSFQNLFLTHLLFLEFFCIHNDEVSVVAIEFIITPQGCQPPSPIRKKHPPFDSNPERRSHLRRFASIIIVYLII